MDVVHKEQNDYCDVHSSAYFIAGAVPTTEYCKHYCQFNEIKVFMSAPFKFRCQVFQNAERSCLGRQSVQRMPNISMEFRSKRLLCDLWKWQFLCATNTFLTFIWHFDTIKCDSEIIELRSSFWSCTMTCELEKFTPRASTRKHLKSKLIHAPIKGAKKYANSNLFVRWI